MSDKGLGKGTHAEVFAEAGLELGVHSVPDELIIEAAEFFKASMVDVDAQKQLEEVEFEVELVDSYMVEALRIKKVEDQTKPANREALRKRMRTAEPFYEEYYGKLEALKRRLRSNHVHEGVMVNASPSTLPLVKQIQAMQKVAEEHEDRAIDFLLGRIEEAKAKNPDAFKYYEEVFLPSWEERHEYEAAIAAQKAERAAAQREEQDG